jgi:hypothetical protein
VLQRLALGAPVLRIGSGAITVPVTCVASPGRACTSDVTVTFNTRHHRLAPITVRGVTIGPGETLDVALVGSKAQRKRLKKIGTIPVTVSATNPPGADVPKAGLLRGNVKKRRR